MGVFPNMVKNYSTESTTLPRKIFSALVTIIFVFVCAAPLCAAVDVDQAYAIGKKTTTANSSGGVSSYADEFTSSVSPWDSGNMLSSVATTDQAKSDLGKDPQDLAATFVDRVDVFILRIVTMFSGFFIVLAVARLALRGIFEMVGGNPHDTRSAMGDDQNVDIPFFLLTAKERATKQANSDWFAPMMLEGGKYLLIALAAVWGLGLIINFVASAFQAAGI